MCKKEEYLSTVAAAGFEDVKIVNGVSVKGIYDSSAAQELTRNTGISADIVREAESSIVSI